MSIKKEHPKLINPTDEINDALNECATTLAFALGYLRVNKVSGSRTIKVDGKVYEVIIEANILKH